MCTPTYILVHIIFQIQNSSIKSMVAVLSIFQQIFQIVFKAEIELQFLTFSGRAFHWVVGLTENADWPKAVWRKGTEQSNVENILVDFMDSSERNLIKWRSGGGARPFKILNVRHKFENNLTFSKLKRWCFSRILQWWYCLGFLSKIFRVCLYRDSSCLVTV